MGVFGGSAPVSDAHLYGFVPASNWSGWKTLVLPEAWLFIAAGFWLLFRVQAPGAGLIAAVLMWQSQEQGSGLTSCC